VPALGIAAAYLLASAVAFALYGLDKHRATRGGRRVPERTLHLVEWFGGWPGAFAASAAFRHKTKKRGFRVVRALIVVVHLAAWAVGVCARSA